MKPEIKQRLRGYSAELHTLGSILSRYRNFMLRTDPNPYVRSRWGFVETVVGPEPRETRKLQRMSLDAESLDALLWQFVESLDRSKGSKPKIKKTSLHLEIQNTLHDMTQPMVSRPTMRRRGESLAELLQECDELGTLNKEDVTYVGDVLVRAMRADWRYYVLFENPLFHQIYAIHRGIIGGLDDPIHIERVHFLKELHRQIEDWAKAGEISVHSMEIEAAIRKVSVEMQKLYDTMGERKKDKKNLEILNHQLLEYRYLFGNVCFYLFQQESGRERLRNLCVFAEQCLEAAETRLQE